MSSCLLNHAHHVLLNHRQAALLIHILISMCAFTSYSDLKSDWSSVNDGLVYEQTLAQTCYNTGGFSSQLPWRPMEIVLLLFFLLMSYSYSFFFFFWQSCDHLFMFVSHSPMHSCVSSLSMYLLSTFLRVTSEDRDQTNTLIIVWSR